jgi:hypothetical protein
MAETKKPSREHFARHYPVVMQSAGLSKSDDLERRFDRAVHTIFSSYWTARDRFTISDYHEALEKYAKGQEMVREALRSLESIHSEIRFAAQLHDTPALQRERLVEAHFSVRARLPRDSKWIAPNRDLDAMVDERDRGITFLRDNPDMLARLLGRRAGDYRKDNETALVVEPALDLLETIGFTRSRKLTRKAFFDALFDLIGIDEKQRPTHRSIDVIASNRRAVPKRQSKHRSRFS